MMRGSYPNTQISQTGKLKNVTEKSQHKQFGCTMFKLDLTLKSILAVYYEH